jgi:hypothetical protein
MARRRMISQEMIYDEEFNSLSIESQNLFIRMLAVSDDFGVVPASTYTLKALINAPDKVVKNLTTYLDEIISKELGFVFPYNGKNWFMFKPSSFETYNSYVLGKRTKSEYLREDKEVMLSENFQEILRNSSVPESRSIERVKNKIKDIRLKNKIKEYTESFEIFWNAYPRKEAKGKALQSFETINPDVILLDIMLKSLELYKKSDQWLKDNGQYIPHPTTWLNQRRWDDKPTIGNFNNGTNKTDQPRGTIDFNKYNNELSSARGEGTSLVPKGDIRRLGQH